MENESIYSSYSEKLFSLNTIPSQFIINYLSSIDEVSLNRMAKAFERQLQLHSGDPEIIKMLGYITYVKKTTERKKN